ncbi:MAG: hypothetical protein IPL40_01345 [Proteobacteria bacterium]|nr:hypothetical protein [Pseudomonadota bacterium]
MLGWLLGRQAGDDSGQAMTEYAIVVALIVVAMVGASSVFAVDFFDALGDYMENFYTMLAMPFP